MLGPASQSAPREAPGDGLEPPAGPHPTLRAPWPRRLAFVVAGAAGTLLVFLAMFTLVERHIYGGRVLPGVEVDGVPSAGRDRIAVYDGVARVGVTLARSSVRVRIRDRELSAGPSLLDLTIDARATTAAAMDAGRHGNPFGQMLGTALRWFRPDHVSLRPVYDENRLEGMLDGWSAETDDGEVEGGLRFVNAKVVPIEPRTGTGIERERARTLLVRMLASSRRSVLTLPVAMLRPRVDSVAVSRAATRARQLLASNHTIVTGRANVRVTPHQLARALGTRIAGHHLLVTLDAGRLRAALAAPLDPIESPPVDASFVITQQNTPRVVPSRNGRGIDMTAVTRAVLRGARRIVTPVRVIAPRHTTKWAVALGIDRQVSSFRTDYPADQTRVINIHRGADLLNSTIVEPGRIFSLNQTIGPRTKARGFVTAPVFAQGEFFDDYGGGVSQLATTTYNAAFFGGYRDITHQPHTIYISRYPAGREATVNYGVIDLEFRDDTPHGILVRTYYSATSITVTLYGDTDGRTAREENRTESTPVPVTDQVFQCPASKAVDPHDVCATLSPGETAQVSTGDAGFDVAFDRVIDQPGKPERREHYTWHYTMLPNQIVVGSAPASTPETPPTSTNSAP